MNLQNLVNYCRDFNLPDPFSGATVPAPLNIDLVKSAIMVRCGLLTPIYTDPETFTAAVTIWFAREQWTFEHLINVIQAEYSPIENVYETSNEKTKYGHINTKTGGYKDSEAGTDSVEYSGKDSVNYSGKDTIELSGKDSVEQSGTDERDISNSGTDTTTNTISAFNSSTYQPDNKSTLEHGLSVDDDVTYGKTEETTYGKTEDTTYGKTEETTYGKSEDTTYGHNVERVYNQQKDTESGIDEIIKHRHGNIGVTTNQQMIREELELLRHFDIYGFISELFEKDNMIMIY